MDLLASGIRVRSKYAVTIVGVGGQNCTPPVGGQKLPAGVSSPSPPVCEELLRGDVLVVVTVVVVVVVLVGVVIVVVVVVVVVVVLGLFVIIDVGETLTVSL